MTIQTKDRNDGDLDIAAENRGGVEYPLNHILNAAGTKIDPATEATLSALNVIAAAVQSAVEAINGKTTAVNTGAIAGTVALDAPTLAALESIQAATGGLTDAQLRAAPVATTPTSPFFWRVGFAEVGSGLQGLAAQELTLLKTGAGMTVSQSAGNLVITTGTTANSETVIRSVNTFRGALLARYKCILSQRIVNQTFRFELADLVGEALAYTINSTTSVTVAFPTGTNPFTAANVGQSMRLAVLSSVGIPGRYAIASVSGDNVTFTVASFPASGSGTLTLYGRNWLAAEYTSTVATNVSFDAQRNGWASGNTTANINTTAAPGHVGQIAFDVLAAGYADSLVASNAAFQWVPRASRIENVPDEDVELYFFLVAQNGSTAPASTTTLTVGFLSTEDQPRNKVRMSGADPATSHALPVQIMGGLLATQPVSGTVTANVAGAGITGGTISPLTIVGVSAEASSAKTATGNSAAAQTNASGRNGYFIVNVSASSGTTPTLVVRVQIQDPVSSTWVDLPGAATNSITGNGATLLAVTNLPRVYRLAWVIGGTTPSFTFSVGFVPVI
jgi:hypothetical protein